MEDITILITFDGYPGTEGSSVLLNPSGQICRQIVEIDNFLLYGLFLLTEGQILGW